MSYLQYPLDRYLVQPMTFGQGTPPSVPSIPVHPQAENIRLPASVAVANNVSKKAVEANSPLRVFAFNAFSSNNWNNEHFANAVRIVADYTLATHRKTGRPLDLNLIEETANNVVAVMTCRFLFHFNLQQYLPPQVVGAASQNAPQFENYESEIRQMHQQQQNAGMYPQQQQTMYPQQQMYPQQNTQQPPQHNHANALYTGGSGFGGGVPQNDEDEAYASRLSTRHSQPQLPQVKHNPQVAYLIEDNEIVQVEKKTPPNTNKVVQERNMSMDRELHRVSYFGGSYITDTFKTVETFQSSIQNMIQEVISDLSVENLDMKEADSIQKAISEGKKVADAKRKNDVNDAIHRELVYIPTTIPFYENAVLRLNDIVEGRGFLEVANVLKKKAEEIKTSSGVLADNPQGTLDFLSAVDIFFKNVVEEFATRGMGVHRLTLDNFSEDIGDVYDWLESKYSYSHRNGFERFEKEFMESFRELRKAFKTDDRLNLLFSMYHMTYLPLNHRELGWSVAGDVSKEVKKATSPMLYSIVDALFKQQSQLTIKPQVNLIITSDAIVYEVFDDYTTGVTDKVYRIAATA